MCEFKIIKKNDESQVAEEILVLSYTDDNELVLKDVLGMGEKLDSALILDVNTLTQKCMVLEHPLVKNFVSLMKNVMDGKVTLEEIDKIQQGLDQLKESIKFYKQKY